MRIWILLSLLLCWLLVSPATGRAQHDPKALIEKAVEAQGGLEKLTAAGAAKRKTKVSFTKDGRSYNGESFSSSPGRRLKLVLHPEAPGQSQRMLVMEGDKGTMTIDGITFNLDDDTLARLKRARHADRVAGLVVLLKEKGFTFTALDEVEVKGKSALGVKVAYDGQPDMHLYFDKASGLLVKTWQKFTEEENGPEITQELYYLDYQPLNPAEEEQKILKAAQLPTEAKKLVQWLKERTPGGDLKKRIETLIEQLGSPAFRVRTKATAELKKIGLEAAPLLRAALQSTDLEVTQRARECLEAIEQDAAVKNIPSAVRLLALRRPQGASAALLQYLPWAPTEEIRSEIQAALFAIAQRDGKPDPHLVKALTDKDQTIREAARAALRRDDGTYEKLPGRRIFVEGVQRPMRSELHRDGQLQMQLQTLQIEYFNRLPDHLFERHPSPEF